MLNPRLKLRQCFTCASTWIEMAQLPAATKRSAGVTPEVNLRNPFHAGDEACKQEARGCQHMILPNFPKNCMKLEEFGPWENRVSKTLLCRSTTGDSGPTKGLMSSKIVFLKSSWYQFGY